MSVADSAGDFEPVPLFAVDRYQVARSEEELAALKLNEKVAIYRANLWHNSQALRQTRGETTTTARMVEDAAAAETFGASSPLTGNVGGVLLGGGLSGFVNILSGVDSLPLAASTIGACIAGTALIANPGAALRVATWIRHRVRPRLQPGPVAPWHKE